MQMRLLYRLLVLNLLLCCSCLAASAAITVDSVVTTNSNCANDGTVTVYAHSPSTMLYAIISGPEFRPAQSGNQFAALPAGTYQIRITNFSGDTTLSMAFVGGAYTFPDFTPTYIEPACAGTATGIIMGNANPAGKPPYTWVITNTATNVTTTQSSDTFYNLLAGTYSIRQFDSCLNFATRSLTLTDPVHTFNITNINNRLFNCDSVELYIQLYIPGGNYALPYTVQVQTPGGTAQQVVQNFGGGGWYPDMYVRFGGVTYGDYCNITVTDACGNTAYMANTICPFIIGTNYSGITDSCQYKYGAYFSLWNSNNLPNVFPTYMNPPVVIKMYDYNTNAFIDSTITGGGDTSVGVAFGPYGQPGKLYSITLTDGCGNTYSNTIQMPVPPAPDTVFSYYNNSCFDSTTSYFLQWKNYFYSEATFTLLSGPSTAHSTKHKYAYTAPISYPQVHPAFHGGNNGLGDNVHYVGLDNLPVGTYTYTISDSCGHTFNSSFVIKPQDVADFGYSLGYIKGCPGQNKIIMSRTETYNTSAFFSLYGTNVQNGAYYGANDTAINLNSGSYLIDVVYYRSSGGSVTVIDTPYYCSIVTDTVVIPAYELPKIDYATQVKCNGTVNVGLLPDSTKGIAPYTYEIISGPQTATVQPSNFFTLTQPGTYTARISDVCGFARTFTFAVDTLAFHDIVKIGSSCIGNSTMLIAQHSPYATYVWHKPNGTQYVGDTLYISPVTNADYGSYDIMKIVSVNNCADTFYTTYILNSSSMNYMYDTICAGDSVIFAGAIYKQPGTYYDTIPAAPCDSIVAFTLTVRSASFDSIVRSICTGQSITVGANTYTATGIYRDTLNTTSGCDSIIVLNLTVDGYKRDSVVQTICYGQSISVGGHMYNATGLYRDTLTTATCDSIHILNLTVQPQKWDSVSASICSGQSILVGTHTYSTTGLYRDTIATATCDSIHILNLTVSDYKRDSVGIALCAGDTINIGGIAYYSTGIYRDTIPTSTCDSIFTLNLTVLPAIQHTINQAICRGDSFSLGNINYSNTGIYTDTLSSVMGCDSVIVLMLTVNDVKRDTLLADICQGEGIDIGGLVYTQGGIYTDTFSTATCDSIRTLIITVHAKPVLYINPSDTTVNSGETFELTVVSDSIYNYVWQSPSGISVTELSPGTVMATAYNSGWVVVQASNAYNCITTDSAWVEVQYCHESIFVPNGFSPNSDGNNDEFRVYGKCILLDRVQVFNRWGEKVWDTPDMEKGWDGYYKGQLQVPGVYVYVVTYFSTAKTEAVVQTLKGSLTLIR